MRYILWLCIILLCFGVLFTLHTRAADITFTETGTASARLTNIDIVNDSTNIVSDIYNADLATTRILDTRTVSAIDTAYDNYTANLRPSDWLSVNSNQFLIYVSSTTGVFTTATINVNCTLMDGTVKNYLVVVTGVGQYPIINDNNTVRASTKSNVTIYISTGSMTYQINQTRWGCIWRDGNSVSGYSYVFNRTILNCGINSIDGLDYFCNLTFTGTIHTTNMPTTGGLVFITCYGDYDNLSFGNGFINNTFTFNKVSITIKQGLSSLLTTIGAPTILIDKSSLYSTEKQLQFDISIVFINNSIISGYQIFGGYIFMKDVSFLDCTSYTFYNNNILLSDCVTIKNCLYAITSASKFTNYILSNLSFIDNTYLVYNIFGAGLVTLIDCESTNWNFFGSPLLGCLYRNYTFRLHELNNLSDITVSIYNNTFNLTTTLTTDAYGSVITQLLHTNYTGSSIVDTNITHNPYTVVITKTGYQTINYTFNITEYTNWSFTMLPNVTTNGSIRNSMFIVGITSGLMIGMVMYDRRKRKK